MNFDLATTTTHALVEELGNRCEALVFLAVLPGHPTTIMFKGDAFKVIGLLKIGELNVLERERRLMDREGMLGDDSKEEE